METIEYLAQIDYVLVILGLFAILFGVKEIIEIFSYFKTKFRIKTGSEEDKETVEGRITILERHDNWQYKEITKISQGVSDIQERLLNKEIEDMRKTILDFCSAISNGQKPNKEAFDFIFRTHEKYNNILDKYHRENNVINESMKFISEKYQELLRNGEL